MATQDRKFALDFNKALLDFATSPFSAPRYADSHNNFRLKTIGASHPDHVHATVAEIVKFYPEEISKKAFKAVDSYETAYENDEEITSAYLDVIKHCHDVNCLLYAYTVPFCHVFYACITGFPKEFREPYKKRERERSQQYRDRKKAEAAAAVVAAAAVAATTENNPATPPSIHRNVAFATATNQVSPPLSTASSSPASESRGKRAAAGEISERAPKRMKTFEMAPRTKKVTMGLFGTFVLYLAAKAVVSD